jgi:hypothetical protein
LRYCCNVDWVTAYATGLANVAVGQGTLRQIGAGARDGVKNRPTGRMPKETTGRRDRHRSLEEGSHPSGTKPVQRGGRGGGIHRRRTDGWREPTRGERRPGDGNRPRVGLGPRRYSSKRQAGGVLRKEELHPISGWRGDLIQWHPQFSAALGAREEIANLVVYVASPLSSATNGAALRVDGGVTPTIG